jgi:predicted TIM-barrel fold metal-dependent hydrolase
MMTRNSILPTRRQAITAGLAAIPVFGAAGPIVDTHVHLFAADEKRFPFSPNAPYRPKPQTVDEYIRFASKAGIDHAIIVHPEPYQDDHRYLEYCFSREHIPMFFKGTCLFDPIAPDTPDLMTALVKRNAGRIVALRIHEVRAPGTPAATGGAIKDRDMHSSAMQATWRRVEQLGLAIQMHFLPYYAPQIGELAARFPNVPVILDHLARGGLGTPAEFDGVLKLASLPRVYMKYSGANYSSKEKYPFRDVKPLVRRSFDAFGADRMIWGDLGYDREYYERQARMLDLMFDFASESDRSKIRGGNAVRLFRWAA